MELYNNGFIVRCVDTKYDYVRGMKEHNNYSGMEGFNWPLYGEDIKNFNLKDKEFYDAFEEEMYKLEIDPNSTNVCNDLSKIIRYENLAKKSGYETQIIFCKSELKLPEYEGKVNEEYFKLLGYDYGFPGGDFYSVIFNDIGRIEEFNIYKLNEFGLLGDINDAIYIKEYRNKLKAENIKRFELGDDYIIYELYLYTGTI